MEEINWDKVSTGLPEMMRRKVRGSLSVRTTLSTFADIELSWVQILEILFGCNFEDVISISTKGLLTGIRGRSIKSVAISTSLLAAHSSKSVSIAFWCDGLSAINTVNIKRSLMTICSISRMEIANGDKLSNRAADTPGLSTPVRRIKPVNCSLSS